MSTLQEHIKNAAKALVANMVSHDAEEWPPTCIVLAYQPMRPIQQANCQLLDHDDMPTQPNSQ